MQCILLLYFLTSTVQLTYINFDYRKDRKMALVTLTSTEEAIDALIVSFILPILKMVIPTQGFRISSRKTTSFHMQTKIC